MGDSVGRISAWALERKLRGPVGSSLDLYRYNATGDLTKTSVQRQLIAPGAVVLKQGQGALLVSLPDLAPGRAEELKKVLAPADRGQTLVLDLRQCLKGSMDEACGRGGPAGLKGNFATLEEAGKPSRVLPVTGTGTVFARLALFAGTLDPRGRGSPGLLPQEGWRQDLRRTDAGLRCGNAPASP